jgi:hypothetical protein
VPQWSGCASVARLPRPAPPERGCRVHDAEHEPRGVRNGEETRKPELGPCANEPARRTSGGKGPDVTAPRPARLSAPRKRGRSDTHVSAPPRASAPSRGSEACAAGSLSRWTEPSHSSAAPHPKGHPGRDLRTRAPACRRARSARGSAVPSRGSEEKAEDSLLAGRDRSGHRHRGEVPAKEYPRGPVREHRSAPSAKAPRPSRSRPE